jgi:threonine dehydrogenase-like Zn-dependent dehydrogenase
MTYCGICGSDIHMYDSELIVPGSIMGHEWVGEVAAVGSDVTGWKVGDRVFPGGRYFPGWEWRPEYAWDLRKWVQDDVVRDMGGYGEYALYHPLSIKLVPAEVTDIEAVMVDQAATGLGAIRASRLQLGDSVLVIGAGPIGLWALRCSQLAGARATAVAELVAGRGDHALKMGADLVVDSNTSDVRRRLTEFFDGTGPDVVLDCGGTESSLNLAIDVVRQDGRIAVVGISTEPVSVSPLKMYLKGLEMHSVLHIDFEGAMELMRRKRFDCRPFLTKTILLEQAPQAFETLLHPTDEEKIVVAF